MNPIIEIIVVGYKAPEHEVATLHSVHNYTRSESYKLFYYNNADKGEELAHVWNRLIKTSSCEYLCLLNNDVYVTPFWLSDMMDILASNPQIGIVSPSTNSAATKQSLVSKAAPLISPENLLTLNHNPYHIEKVAALYRNNWKGQYEDCTVSGFCWLFRKSLWKEIGGFNEAFKHYGQENEFSYWAKHLGYRVVWAKGVYVHHWGAVSYDKAVAAGERNDETERTLAKKLLTDFTIGSRRNERMNKLRVRGVRQSASEEDKEGRKESHEEDGKAEG
jgi:hypothetical protein